MIAVQSVLTTVNFSSSTPSSCDSASCTRGAHRRHNFSVSVHDTHHRHHFPVSMHDTRRGHALPASVHAWHSSSTSFSCVST